LLHAMAQQRSLKASADVAVSRRRGRLWLALISISLVAAACTSTQEAESPARTRTFTAETSIPNEGGENEGHTPIGFPGMGTGLFAGDNLNSQFPDGDGVQAFLTFALPESLTATSATLRSNVLQSRGTPFDDLGALVAERVEYTEFGPHLFDLPSSGDPSVCTVIGGTAIACDVTKAVQSAAAEGAPSVQFRLRFERVADNDGQADLAMFYRSDSNTNEEGLFVLVVNGS
jgi:hypothetical protein